MYLEPAGHSRWAVALSAPILVECAVLAVNRRRRLLTDMAGRYTHDRAANFDIYVPEPLATRSRYVISSGMLDSL